MSVIRLLLLALLALGAVRPAQAAVGEFFWAGIQLADPTADAPRLEALLRDKIDHRFRGENRGAVKPLLGSLAWDEFLYHESAARTGYVKENMADVYGLFLSVDRIMRFRPTVVTVAGSKATRHYTYVFVTLNLFAADSRNLVFSHPVFLTDVFDKPASVEQLLVTTLGKLADQLREGSNPFVARLKQRLQAYFGPRGVSLEAIRRTRNPIHSVDTSFADTWGVMAPCDECVAVMDRSGLVATPETRVLGDFARFFLNARMALFHQVAFVPEQSALVQEKTGDIAAAAKEGDIRRDLSQICLAEYDETGQSRICVKVLPPRTPVWLGVRSLVQPEEGPGSMVPLKFLTAVDLEAERPGRSQPLAASLTVDYPVPAVRGQEVSDVHYVNALVKALDQFGRDSLR